jgi:DNA topoisomerase I
VAFGGCPPEVSTIGVTSSAPAIETAAVESARQAGLRYVSDRRPGISRRRRGRGFEYRAPDGSTITDSATLERPAALAIPPAWSDVWICPSAGGRLQATGRDARGRKQYRYHTRWRQVRDETKYHRTLVFGPALPGIRGAISTHLGRTTMSQQRALTAVVRLLDGTTIASATMSTRARTARSD